MKNLTNFTKDLENKKLHVTRTFNAPLELVWSTWTEPELLEQWWAPKPYKTVIKFMDFKEGGHCLYYMLSPEGDKHWCRADYLKISKHHYFTVQDAFCNEEGVPNTEHPSMHWNNQFESKENTTHVKIEISFDKVEDIQKIIDMGFKEGFTAALENLDDCLKQQLNEFNNQNQ